MECGYVAARTAEPFARTFPNDNDNGARVRVRKHVRSLKR